MKKQNRVTPYQITCLSDCGFKIKESLYFLIANQKDITCETGH